MKANIMRAVNTVIEALLFSHDLEFVDSVVNHVVYGVTFEEEEIREAEQAEEGE